jgi:hypothetical protein
MLSPVFWGGKNPAKNLSRTPYPRQDFAAVATSAEERENVATASKGV